jgi:hypothetical protein
MFHYGVRQRNRQLLLQNELNSKVKHHAQRSTLRIEFVFHNITVSYHLQFIETFIWDHNSLLWFMAEKHETLILKPLSEKFVGPEQCPA